MSNNKPIQIDFSKPILPSIIDKKRSALTPKAFVHWVADYNKMKKSIDQKGAEVSQSHDKMTFLHDIVCEINIIIDDQNAVDLKNKVELLDKIRTAVNELDVQIDVTKMTYTSSEFIRLIQNLNLKADGLDRENKRDMQKIDTYNKLSNQLMMVLKTIEKAEDRALSSMTRGSR